MDSGEKAVRRFWIIAGARLPGAMLTLEFRDRLDLLDCSRRWSCEAACASSTLAGQGSRLCRLRNASRIRVVKMCQSVGGMGCHARLMKYIYLSDVRILVKGSGLPAAGRHSRLDPLTVSGPRPYGLAWPST